MYIVSYDVAFVPRRCKRRCKKFHMNVNADVNADVSYECEMYKFLFKFVSYRHIRHFASPFDDTYRHIPPSSSSSPYRHIDTCGISHPPSTHIDTDRHIDDTYPPFFLLPISTYRHNTYRHRARPILPPSHIDIARTPYRHISIHIPLFLIAITCIGYFNLIIFALQ